MTAAIGCLLVAAGLGIVPGGGPRLVGPAADGTAEELRVAVRNVAWVYADDPETPTDPATGLRAGDTDGGAVTYLKFTLPYAATPERVLLELTGAEQPLPGLVELASVPDASWDPDGLTWAEAPVLGPVVESVQPGPDGRVVFDVTDLAPTTGQGAGAFAVTVPPDQGHAVFVGTGGDAGRPVLRLSGLPRHGAPPGLAAAPGDAASGVSPPAPCLLGELLVPTCGVLWGVAPDAHTGSPRVAALADFEAATGRRQDIYHAYHRAQELFPTDDEAAIAAEGRLLFLNWKPVDWSWAQIARGDPTADSYLDRLADHIDTTFTDPFFFTIHHEPEDDVRPWAGSGWQAADYAAMYRHVVERLRARGVDNLVTVMDYLAYVPWNTQPWFPELYPGDDVVDWIAWNSYAYSDPGYGYGDFAEMMNRRSSQYPDWPGFYTWATELFGDKPFMLGEWGVWFSRDNPDHMAGFYDSIARQAPLFPRVKAMVYFETPGDQRGRDSRPAATESGLAAYRRLGSQPYFQVQLDR